MTTIKNFTDITQSKKLAKILPSESADMYYFDDNGGEPNFKVRNGITYYYDSEDFLCCWSLAALLSALPEIQGGKPVIALNDNYITYPHMNDLHTKAGNLVDACVAMIEKLNEQNLL